MGLIHATCQFMKWELACVVQSQPHCFASHLLSDLSIEIVILLQCRHDVEQLVNTVKLQKQKGKSPFGCVVTIQLTTRVNMRLG